jgi:hypothetical protein
MPTLITTKGGANSNSYVDIMLADATIDTMYLLVDKWNLLDDDNKVRLLIQATKDIDTLPVKYQKVNNNQSLKFPVINKEFGDDGFLQAQLACIEQAVYLMEYTQLMLEGQADKIAGVTQKSIGNLSTSLRGLSYQISPLARIYLKRFINFGISIIRG